MFARVKFGLLLCFISLLLSIFTAASAQDTTSPELETTPEVGAETTDEPIAETPVEVTTDIPTEIPTIPPETTPELTPEIITPESTPETTEIPVETTPPVDLPTPTDVVTQPPASDEPPLQPVFSENFDSGISPELSPGSGWLEIDTGDGQALQSSAATEPVIYQAGAYADLAAEGRFFIQTGAGQISVRLGSDDRSYTAALDAAGGVTLYRAGQPLQSALVTSPAGAWHMLRLSAIGSTLRVTVDGVMVIKVDDPDPLPLGLASFNSTAGSSLRVDDFAVFAPEGSLPIATATPETEMLFSTEDSLNAACRPWTEIGLVSLANDGTQINPSVGNFHISADGRYVVYYSSTNNIVAGDTNSSADVFRFDRQTCANVLVSVNTLGQAAGASSNPVISANGQYVAFRSTASSMVSGNSNPNGDVYVRDLNANITYLISGNYAGTPSIGGHGSSIIMSPDARYIAFMATDDNLMPPGQDNHPGSDVFLRDRSTNNLTLVTRSYDGSPVNGNPNGVIDISDDGRYVVYASEATNAVAGDTNNLKDVFRYDVLTNVTERVSVNPDGTQAGYISQSASMSADGRYIALSTLIDHYYSGEYMIYVRDMQSTVVEQVSLQDISNTPTHTLGYSVGGEQATISADGRYVVFIDRSYVAGLDAESDYQIFVRDRVLGRTTRVSSSAAGVAGNGTYDYPIISADGNYVIFREGSGTNLVPDDTRTGSDLYVAPRPDPVPMLETPSNLAFTSQFLTNWTIQINTTWTDNASSETTYTLEMNDHSDFWYSTAYIQNLPPDTSSYTFTTYDPYGYGGSVSCGTNYYFRLRGYRWQDNRYTPYIYWQINVPCPPPFYQPYNFTVTALSSSQIRMNWLDMEGEAAYHLEKSLDNTAWTEIAVLPADTLTYTDSGLVCGGSYYYRIRARNAVYDFFSPYSVPWPEATTTPVCTPLTGAPTLTSPANNALTNDTTPALAWNSLNGAVSYEVQIDNTSDFASPLSLTNSSGITELSYIIDPALAETPGTVYYWRVRGYSSPPQSTPGSWSAYRAFTLDTSPLTSLATLKTPLDGATSTIVRPTLSWLALSGAGKYRLQVNNDETFTDSAELDILLTTTSYPIPANSPALGQGVYYWRVLAIDPAGNEGNNWSLPWAFTINLLKSPAHQAAIVTTNARPAFQWYTVTGNGGYTLEVASDEDFNSIVYDFSTTSATTGNHTIPAAEPALAYGTYYWRVNVSGLANVSPVWWQFTITPPVPPAPILASPASASFTNVNTVALNWNAVTYSYSPVTYEVQVDNQNTFASLEYTASDVDVLTVTTSALNDSLYYWRVRAVNQWGAAGAWSKVSTFTVDTEAVAVPALNMPLDAASVTTSQPSLTWRAALGAVRYEIQLDITNPPQRTYPVTKTSFKPASPLLVATYYWRVRAYDAAGNIGEWSETRALNITSATSAAPLTQSHSAAPVILTWTPITWSAGYQVQVDDNNRFTSLDFDSGTLAAGTTTANTPELPPGTYYWRVRAFNGTTWGAWSKTYSFRVES